MKLSKNEVKTLAKTAKRIMSDTRVTGFDNSTRSTENAVTASAMLEELKQCSRWNANQYNSTVFVSASTCNFTIEL